MKKTLILFLISISGFSQVTISGAFEAYLNTTFNSVGYNAAMDDFSCTTFPPGSYPPEYKSYDVGTNIYTALINLPTQNGVNAYIIRRQGQWNIEGRDPFGGYTVFYRTQGVNSDLEPPCDGVWEKWDSWCFSYGDIEPTGILVSNIQLTGNCTSCQTLSSVVLPELIDFPVISDTRMSSLTVADGLRMGSTAFNCTLNSLVLYNGCEWTRIETESLYKPAMTHGSMTVVSTTSASQEISFDWVHPKPSLVSQFVLQYSTNHGPWIDYQTFSNTVFSYTSNNLGTYSFSYNQTYQWRIKAIETCGNEVYSCSESIYFPFSGNVGSGNPALINIDAPFTVGSGILIKMVANNIGIGLTSWEYDLDYFDGTTWQNVIHDNLTISAFPHSFILAGGSLIFNGKYRIRVNNPTYGGAGYHYVEFYYSPAKELCE